MRAGLVGVLRRRRAGSHHALLQRRVDLGRDAQGAPGPAPLGRSSSRCGRAGAPCQLSDAEPIRTSRVFPPFWIASASQSAMELRPHHSRLLLVPKNNSLTKRNACLRELPSGMGLSRSGAKFHPQGAGRSCRDHSRRDSRRRFGSLSGQPSNYRVVGSGAHVGQAYRDGIGGR